MAMMGLLHRAALGKGPAHFKKFFRLSTAERPCTRSGTWRHNRQLIDIRNEHFLEIQPRSALGSIWVYNRLPAEIARHDTVKYFQTSMQHLLKDRLAAGCTDCMSTFSLRVPAYCNPMKWNQHQHRPLYSIVITVLYIIASLVRMVCLASLAWLVAL